MVDKPTTQDGNTKALEDAAKKAALGLLEGVVYNQDPITEPSGLSAEEAAALQYIYDQSNSPKVANNNTPAEVIPLVREESQDNLVDIGSVMQLIAMIDNCPDDNVQTELSDERKKLKDCIDAVTKGIKPPMINLAEISSKVTSAVAEAGKAETPQQKVDRLWGEIKESNKKIDKAMEELEANGAITPEEKKRREELKERAEKGDLEAMRKLAQSDRSVLERIIKESSDPNVKKLATDALNEVAKNEQRMGDMTKIITKAKGDQEKDSGAVAKGTENAIKEQEEKILKSKNLQPEEVGKDAIKFGFSASDASITVATAPSATPSAPPSSRSGRGTQ